MRAVAGWQSGRGVLIVDEPTAALAAHEVDQLFTLIRDISATGTAVILVSHRLDEVMAVADHATVMREGRKVWDGALSDTSLAGLVDLIANTETEAPGAIPKVVFSRTLDRVQGNAGSPRRRWPRRPLRRSTRPTRTSRSAAPAWPR